MQQHFHRLGWIGKRNAITVLGRNGMETAGIGLKVWEKKERD
jgi:hypothetical protein